MSFSAKRTAVSRRVTAEFRNEEGNQNEAITKKKTEEEERGGESPPFQLIAVFQRKRIDKERKGSASTKGKESVHNMSGSGGARGENQGGEQVTKNSTGGQVDHCPKVDRVQKKGNGRGGRHHDRGVGKEQRQQNKKGTFQREKDNARQTKQRRKRE